MKPTMQPATMMVGTVVDLVSIQILAQNVYVLGKLSAMGFPIYWLEMGIVKMKPTMLTVTLMEETVVWIASKQHIVQNVFVMKNRNGQIL